MHRAPHAGLFRLTDTAVIVLVMAWAFLVTNHGQVADFEQFLALRISLKNLLLLAGFVLLLQGILTAAAAPEGPRGGELARMCSACTATALVAALAPLTGLTRSFGLGAVAVFWVTSVPAAMATRRLARAVASVVRCAPRVRQVIIVGSGPRAYQAFLRLRACPDAPCRVVGFVDTNRRVEIPEIRELHLGPLSRLEEILMHRNVDLVVIALPVKSQYARIQESIQVCERVGVESRYPADLFEGRLARQEYVADAGIPAVAMKVVQDDARMVVKRVVDVVLSLVALVALSPILLVIALSIRLTSPGPILFAQERYGLNRRTFRMYKFRTMISDADRLQPSLEHLNEATGPVFKIRNDPRVTPVGRFLRRTSLDELPQLVNVVKGDMSLVGPRPLPLRDVQHFAQGALMRRFSVPPGLTCLWQISGRGNLGFDDWVRMDLRYIDGWSLRLDLKILLLTIPAVLRGAGAW